MVPHQSIDERTERVAALLRDYYVRSRRVLDRAVSGHGVTYARARFLVQIERHGPLRSIDLAGRFGYAPRTVTEAIDGMERDGLVRRDPDREDRRAKRISLTAEGARVVEGAERTHAAHVARVFEALSAAEREELARLLAKLNARLAEMEDR